jgi:lycopene cyclase domain-containing protein
VNAGGATYALLDLVFLAAVAVVGVVAAVVAGRRARAAGRLARWRRVTAVTGLVVLVVLLVMTIVFDNVIVGLRIVAYDPDLISGLHLGFAPVEDLSYAVAAVVLLPSLAVLLAPRRTVPTDRREPTS